ncbi:uncharacterized protein LOC144868168 isoform X1 [Branchiostoma floridae x Branchiostoma japonicum]
MAGEESEEDLGHDHTELLRRKCRLCGDDVGERNYPCLSYKEGFSKVFGIELDLDAPSIHPPEVCHKCRCIFDRYAKAPCKDKFQTYATPYLFEAHSESCQICYDKTTVEHNYTVQKRGKKRGRKRKVSRHAGPGRGGKKPAEDDNKGMAESDIQTDKAEVTEASTHTDTDNRGMAESDIRTDKAEVTEASTQTDTGVCGYVVHPLQPNLGVPIPVLCQIVTKAASSQRQAILQDIKNIGGLYRKPEALVKADPIRYFSDRNAVCQSFVNGLVDDKKTTVASKVMTLEQLYHLASPVLVAPFSFSRNLLTYAITNSKLVVDMLGKVSPGGMFDTVKSYLQNIATKPLPFPEGDCEVAIDNDQKLKKQWSVRAQGKMTCSVVTSVCQVQHSDKMELQGREDLSPATWGKYLEKARGDEETKERLTNSVKVCTRSSDIHRAEVRKLIHSRLNKVLNEQKLEDGKYVDYIDKQVAEAERSKNMKRCAHCGTEVPKTKRICANQACRGNFKEIEEAATGRQVFGTMLLQPVKKYSYRPKEIQISVQNDKTTTVEDITIVTYEEYADIPTFHPASPPPITMSDPVFVNPNSASAMRKVLRHVGKTANIVRYADESQTNTRSWLIVAMDGLPLGITRTVIAETMYCTECKRSCDSSKLFENHMSVEHPHQRIPPCREFDWVILRVGKLHLEMNALKAYVDLNWNVWFSALAHEMGFKSEGAQRVAKNCADHHKSMQMLQIAIKGCTDELVLLYVQEKLERGGERHHLSRRLYMHMATTSRRPQLPLPTTTNQSVWSGHSKLSNGDKAQQHGICSSWYGTFLTSVQWKKPSKVPGHRHAGVNGQGNVSIRPSRLHGEDRFCQQCGQVRRGGDGCQAGGEEQGFQGMAQGCTTRRRLDKGVPKLG